MPEDKTLLSVSVYDKIAKEYNAGYSLKSELKFLTEFLKLIPKKSRMLEAGCGDGRTTEFFYKKGCEIIGIDLSKNMLKIARKNFPKIKFKKMDMRKLKFKNGYFDAVIVPYSLFHITKKEVPKTIREFYRVLKPNGKIMIISINLQ